ncbi:Hsp70 family protein [Rhodococcus wratislaviensis]|uniref:Hsp70 family protein n=1 Tax=Rhodococcus wratislaviensis TaxID=44752 RepID=UPI001788C5C5|nr:Hsp70 family protein [Rhodococcus wratislaviensis]
MSSSWLLGIDFGTANTAAASMEPGSSPSVVPLAGERTVMPSAVFVESPNTITAGRAVIDAADRNPGGVTPTPKRSVGLHAVPINGYDIAPVRLVTAVLGETVNRAIAARTAQLGRAESPAQLILTHPEDWTPDEIRVLHDAAAALGFDPASVRVISEPHATAHQCVSANIAAGTKFGVVDVGAGTLDVTVLEATGRGEFTVVAAHRDHALGGAAVDAAVRGWVDSRLAAENPQLLTYLRENSPAGDLRRLDDSIRRAKELLSTAPSATITVTGAGHVQNIELSRGIFDSLIGEMVTRSLGLVERALADAGVRGSDLYTVYLTGGASRIPLLHQRLSSIVSVTAVDDPKTVVARGALNAAGIGAVNAAPAPVPHTAPVWSTPAAVPQPAGRTGRAKVWAAAAAAAAVVVVGGAVVLSQTVFSDDAASAGPSQTAVADPVADEQAIRELTTAYARDVPGAGIEVVNSFRCAQKQATAEDVVSVAGEELAIDEIISVSTNGDAGSARVRLTQTLPDSEPTTSTQIFTYTREDSGWKICGIRTQ